MSAKAASTYLQNSITDFSFVAQRQNWNEVLMFEVSGFSHFCFVTNVKLSGDVHDVSSLDRPAKC